MRNSRARCSAAITSASDLALLLVARGIGGDQRRERARCGDAVAFVPRHAQLAPLTPVSTSHDSRMG